MQLTPQRGKAAALSQIAALPIDTPTADSRDHKDISDDERLTALRRQFAPFGLSIYRLIGSELALTGVGLSRCLPDDRCAYVYLRQLRGGAA